MFDDTNLNDLINDLAGMTPMGMPQSETFTNLSFKIQKNQTPTNKQPGCSEKSADSSNTQSKTDGRKPHSEHFGMTPKALQVHAVHVRETVEKGLIKRLKMNGTVSSAQLYEVIGESAYLGARAVNSTRAAWEEEVVINRPDYLVDWAKAAVPMYSNMVYIKPEKHPQLSHIRSRVTGITHGELRRGRMDFEDAYAVEFESTVGARAAFEKLMEMVSISYRFNPEMSVVPELANHYRMDAASRTYALGAHRADMPLILSSID